MSASFARVAVLGLGLIGGSMLRAIRQTGLDVVGYDIDEATAAAASASGFPVAPTDEAALHGADLVVLAMPLPQVPDALQSLAPHRDYITAFPKEIITPAPGTKYGTLLHDFVPMVGLGFVM